MQYFKPRRTRRHSLLMLPAVLAGTLLPGGAGFAQSAGELFEQHLAAGEFAPAMALASRQSDHRRDELVAEVAKAQARSGARLASFRAAGEISDDRLRADTLRRLSAEPLGGRGGAAEADFESLIELITTTVSPNTWEEVGGPGAIDDFEGGVYVDAEGVLQRLLVEDSGSLTVLVDRSRSELAPRPGGSGARRSSPLRMVSLPRLEKQVQLRLAAGLDPTETMQALAGLQRIEYVFVYPEEQDIVIAGPAGDWRRGTEDRLVSVEGNKPVVQLDDLVVILRHMTGSTNARFGCSITPTREGLARVKAFLRESGKRSIPSSRRERWLEQLRASLGQQLIDVYGIDPRTRVARVLVEADYRMKLVGMDLEEGVLGVESYLDAIRVRPGEDPPPMDVLRWWFTLNYDAVLATRERDGFQLRGQGVRVLSENELLTEQGKRIHTGKSDALNSQFAHSFTKHFGTLAGKYPIYAELRNLFDIAMVGALLRTERLPEKIDWDPTCFGKDGGYEPEHGPAAEKVDTVINHRVVGGKTILAGVSGGVRCDPLPLLRSDALKVDSYGRVKAERWGARPEKLDPDAWWWDQP